VVRILERHHGGILGLSDIVGRHGEALRADLLKAGLHLDDIGTPRLGWHELLAFVKDARTGSALAISMAGQKARWTDADYLLAAATDALNGANWQRSGGRFGQPKKIPRPGDTSRGETQHIGSGAVTVEEFDEWLARKQASKPQES